MRFGAACSNVHDPWSRGCSTIPRVHVFSSASQPAGILSHPNGARHFGELCRSDYHSDWFRLLSALAPAGVGSGDSRQDGYSLEAATRLRNEVIYFPIDVLSDALDAACDSIGCLLPDVQLRPMVANDVTHPPKLERFNGTTLAMYIGSSIGNFSPEEARTIRCNLRSGLRAGDALLLGTVMVKDEATLVRAYDERDGVTAAFNLNVLHRLNRELGANFDSGCFRHRARWNQAKPLLAPCSIHGRPISRPRSTPRGVQESSDPSRGGSRSSRRAGRARGR
jgi:hypothetical protein